jgi:hypothetical protein
VTRLFRVEDAPEGACATRLTQGGLQRALKSKCGHRDSSLRSELEIIMPQGRDIYHEKDRYSFTAIPNVFILR